MRKVSVLWIMALLVVGVVIAGCGDDDSDEGGGGGSADSGGDAIVAEAQQVVEESTEIPTEIPSAQFGPVKPKAGTTIYHVACDLALQGCASKAKGLREAAAAIGFEYEQCDGGSSPDTISACFTNAVNAKPDVIIPNGIGVDAAGEGYAAAAKAGIPIVGMFTGNPPGADGVVTEVAGETCGEAGKWAADWVIADSEGSANALFVGTQTYKCNQQRKDSWTEEMDKCSGCETSFLNFSIDSIQSTLPQQIQAELQSNADVDYITGTFDAIALTAADAVRQAGKANTIKVTGFDADAPNLELVRNGEIQQIDITTGATEPSWTAIDAAARIVDGQELPEVTPVTLLMVTGDNIEEVGESYTGATGFEEQFEELWGK